MTTYTYIPRFPLQMLSLGTTNPKKEIKLLKGFDNIKDNNINNP